MRSRRTKQELIELVDSEKREDIKKEVTRNGNSNYNINTVDRINFTVPKGKKAEIQSAAAARGLSVNAFVSSVILAETDRINSEE